MNSTGSVDTMKHLNQGFHTQLNIGKGDFNRNNFGIGAYIDGLGCTLGVELWKIYIGVAEQPVNADECWL